MSFLRSLGYSVPTEGDEVELDKDLCRPLRILGDLHFDGEESAGNVELTEVGEIERQFGTEIDADEREKLTEYIESHPRLTDEKRSELAKELSDLKDATETNEESDDGTGLADLFDERNEVDTSNESDLVELFRDTDDEKPEIPDDVKSVIDDWQPLNVGVDYINTDSNTGEEVKTEKHPAVFEEEVAEVSGFTHSLRTMQTLQDGSNFNIQYVRPGKFAGRSILVYKLDDIVQQLNDSTTCEWECIIRDIRGQDILAADFELALSISRGLFNPDLEHEVSIEENRITRWSIIVDGQEVTNNIREEFDPKERHRIFCDRCAHMNTIREFLSALPDYELEQVVEWGGFV
jgi:hypothetical protein